MSREVAYIALGSNQGDRRDNLDHGMSALDALPQTALVKRSSYRWTPPWGLREQPWFLNAAAAVETALEPRALMDALLSAESERGRVRDVPNGPRTLDLDILLYGDRVVEDEGLFIPHPRMAQRLFVLAPLGEIAPHIVHPVLGETISVLLGRIKEAQPSLMGEEE
ncbi:MAG: 2-amino-4-hydroxy-6-hydroxymethyldihydropteridine diphosphokinase [Planctomycetota bacterium]|jgi:2-amino-4-hydroxy-6-hydroxymethyldihydropteridine diphosphokinase